MDKIVTIDEARAHLSCLLKRVQSGEEIIIARAGKPIARIIPVLPLVASRNPGTAAGRVVVADDFDVPLPDNLLEEFEQ